MWDEDFPGLLGGPPSTLKKQGWQRAWAAPWLLGGSALASKAQETGLAASLLLQKDSFWITIKGTRRSHTERQQVTAFLYSRSPLLAF